MLYFWGMEVKNYCIIVLGKVEGVKEEIKAIATSYVNLVEHDNIVIATFSSPDSAKTIKEFFVIKNRGFFLFELGKDNYGVNVRENNIYDALFKPFEEGDGSQIEDEILNRTFIERMSDNPRVKLSTDNIDDIIELPFDELSIEEEIKYLNNVDKQQKLNEIIDKGVENMSELDKIWLKKLTNS